MLKEGFSISKFMKKKENEVLIIGSDRFKKKISGVLHTSQSFDKKVTIRAVERSDNALSSYTKKLSNF